MAYINQINKNIPQESDSQFNFLKTLAPIAGAGIGLAFGNPMLGYQAGNMASQFLKDGGMLNEFQGPTHEQGGIQLQGGAAEVEGGETSMLAGAGQMVFSDSLIVPGTKETFAQASKRIEAKYKRRGDDSYANAAKERELARLAQKQEEIKMSQQAEQPATLEGGAPMGEMPQQEMFNVGGMMLPEVAKMLKQNRQAIGLGYGAQAATNLPMLIEGFKKPEKVNLGRVSAETIDLSSQRQKLDQDRLGAGSSAKRMAGRGARNATEYMSMINAHDAGVGSQYRSLIDQNKTSEEIANAQARTQAGLANQQTRIQEEDINAREKAARASMRHQALSNIGGAFAGGVSDWTAAGSSANMMDMTKKYYQSMMGDDTTTEEKKKLLEEINRKVNPSEIFNYPSTGYAKFGGILKSKRIGRK
jgi:hypothetical protein